MRGLSVFEWKITEIGCGENEHGTLSSPPFGVILGGIQAWVPDFIGTAETKKPQISRPGAFSCISGAPAPFEPGVKDPVFKGFFLLGVPKGYTRGYTALAAGMFLDRFTPAEKAVEVRCSIPDKR